MERFDWSRLNSHQLGRYAEYFVKMEFTLFGFDVYTSEVDDHGIDFVVRSKAGRHWDIQVKSSRKYNYIFLQKSKFPLGMNMMAAVVLFIESEAPKAFLIPASAWQAPNQLFADRDYEGKKSKPEWGLNLSQKNIPLLEPYTFERTLAHLSPSVG